MQSLSPYQILDVGCVEIFCGVKTEAVVGVRDAEDVLEEEGWHVI